VHYVLEGSVRRSGDRVRVSAQLIDAESDVHLWAERFDGDTSDLFAFQDEVAGRIAVALNLELPHAAAARAIEHPDAFDYILRGRAAAWKPPSRERYVEMIGHFDRALVLDPRSIEAQSWLAAALTARVLDNMSNTIEADLARVEGLVGQALARSSRSPLAHFAKAQLLRAQRRYAEAIPEYEAVLASDRNRVFALFALAHCKLYSGSIEETIPLVERAIRLSPRDPSIGTWYWLIGFAHLLQSRTEDAIIWLEKARNVAPELPYVHAWLASAYGLKGWTEPAAAELAEARRFSRDYRYSSMANYRVLGPYRTLAPKVPALLEVAFEGLRKAGMPEE
jgi:tetratricopeptide (TPR) repeat protein